MKIKVRELKKPVLRKRTDGEKLVRYKVLEVIDFDIGVNCKITDVSSDHDGGNRMGGTFYLTEEEFKKMVDNDVKVKVIPVDEALIKHEIPKPA